MRPLPYAAFFCEENAWHAAQDERIRDHDPHVVFVTNARRQCALFFQRAAHAVGAPVFWDYHVLVVAKTGPDGWEVWDPDTLLGCPIALRTYLEKTFAMASIARLAPLFRVFPAEEYIRSFSSDRRHMRNARGRWHRPPPPWPAIVRDGIGSNLDEFIDVERPDVLDVHGLARRFGLVLS
jgi:hypothetical protein